LREVTARRSRQAALPARIMAAAAAGRPAAFVERRRRNDPSGFFTGPRDRRVLTRT
jgi:hypothetical protein